MKLNTPSSDGFLAPQTTLSSDPLLQKSVVVLLERPRPLQPFWSLHKSVPQDQEIFSTNTLLSSSRATSPSAGAGYLSSTDIFVSAVGANRPSLTASRNESNSAPPSVDGSRFLRPSDTASGLILAIGRNKSSTPAWSPSSPIAHLAPASSAVRTTSAGSTIGGGKSASASHDFIAAASGTGESPRLVDFLNSIKNRTKSETGLHPWLGPRPQDVRPVYSPLSGLRIGSLVTPGAVIQKPPLATAIGSDRISSTKVKFAPSGTGESSALRNYLESMNKTKTESRNSQRLKAHLPSVGLSLSGFNASAYSRTGQDLGATTGGPYLTSCSGRVTSTAHVVYQILTSTILVNETITLGPNATTPLPILISPPPACQTITAPCEGSNCPLSSTLPIFPPIIGPYPHPKMPVHPPPKALTPYTPSTTISTLLVTKKFPAIVQQLSAVGNLFGPSTPTPQTIAAQPNTDGQQAAGQNSGSSDPDVSIQSDDSSESDSNGQSTGKSTPEQNPTKDNFPSTSSNSQNPHSQKPGAGTSRGQSTGSDDQTASNGNNLNGDASNNGGASSNGDSSSSEGDVLDAGGVSSNGVVSNAGQGPSDEDGPESEAGSSADSHGTQYVPSIVMAGNLPVSIVSNAVFVGSHIINAGSPPTTVVASGQTIAIQPSQIVAQGKTVSIQAAVTPPPAKSATIGDVPIVLRPQDVAIGSKAFQHGSSPTSVVYNGHTYSWDASHLAGAGAAVVSPSVHSSAPRVTAGGQIFSVFPSQLKASGRNIPLPNTAGASPFVYKGQTFSVNPSQLIAPGTSITLPPTNKITPFVYIDHSLSVDVSQFMARSTTIPFSSGSGTITYNGQVLTIKPSEIIGPSTTIALWAPHDSAAAPTAITTGGLTFSIGPAAAVVGSSTYSFVPGKAPATIMTHNEAVLVGSNGVQFGNVHVSIPTIAPSISMITQGDLTFSVAPSEVVVAGRTDYIRSDMTPITTVVNGHTISIGPKGVGFASTTITLPTPKPRYSIATEGDLTLSVAPSEVVVKGKTYSIAPNKAPITTHIDGQIMTIGPKGIHLEGTTVNLPVLQTPMTATAGGLTFSVGATDAVISGTTCATGSGIPFQTVVIGSQNIEIGSAGIMLPSTTIAPEQTSIAVTANSLTFSVDATEAVINGTTYAIGSGAVAKTIAAGSITVILGTDGIALPSTTIRPWSNAAQTGFSSVLGTSGALSTAMATGPLRPIFTGKESDIKHATGVSTRVPKSRILLVLGFGNLILGPRLM